MNITMIKPQDIINRINEWQSRRAPFSKRDKGRD